MAELADALDSGSSARKGVEVQVLSSALVNNGVSRHRGKPRFLLAADALKMLGLKQAQRQILKNWAEKLGKPQPKKGFWYLDDIKFLKREYAPTLDRDV